MKDQTRIVRVLIVEDDEWQRQGIKNDLGNISPDQKKRLGISSFECDEASSVNEAELLLAEARKQPYDLLLLDLSLPHIKGDWEESPDNGFKLLETIRTNHGAHETIVISRFVDYWNVSKAFRGGALDFIAKPYDSDILQARVSECWKRILAKESNRLFEQRTKELMPFDGKALAHQFSACFSRFIQTVLHENEEMGDELSERLGPRDSLIDHLGAMKEAVRRAKDEWTELHASLSGEADTSNQCVVEEALYRIGLELLPCLKMRNVELDFPLGPKTAVLSFQEDVSAVLKEIIIGSLDNLKDHGDPPRTISVSVSRAGEYARVHFSGDLLRIDPATAARIEKGERLQDGSFGQLWGLSVAQYIARRGGGRLQIGSEENSDSITYLIPLARHD